MAEPDVILKRADIGMLVKVGSNRKMATKVFNFYIFLDDLKTCC